MEKTIETIYGHKVALEIELGKPDIEQLREAIELGAHQVNCGV